MRRAVPPRGPLQNPQGDTYTLGASAKALSVTAEAVQGESGVSAGELTYQWYSSTASGNAGGEEITDATDRTCTPPTGAAGTRYYYVVVTNTVTVYEGTTEEETFTATAASNAATVTVREPYDPGPEEEPLPEPDAPEPLSSGGGCDAGAGMIGALAAACFLTRARRS